METQVRKYNLQGENIGTAAVDNRLAQAEANSQLIKDYIVALRANARQWSANTQGRSEVNHTKKKPHAQKGGGRARQGSLSAPQYKGGGRAFGPKPKFDQHVRINQKERLAAIRALLAEKIRDSRLIVLKAEEVAEPKTKLFSTFIDQCDLQGRVLFLGEGSFVDISVEDVIHRFSIPTDKHTNIVKSIRNIPHATFKLVSNISGYDVMRAGSIVILEPALEELQEWLLKGLKG
ncbi:MAG: 50S ribosomal protein L4 [Verrucomicrobia bacterium]|nr:50S ribosomal protein L4 [Verrucomicrobiota bacterium]